MSSLLTRLAGCTVNLATSRAASLAWKSKAPEANRTGIVLLLFPEHRQNIAVVCCALAFVMALLRYLGAGREAPAVSELPKTEISSPKKARARGPCARDRIEKLMFAWKGSKNHFTRSGTRTDTYPL